MVDNGDDARVDFAFEDENQEVEWEGDHENCDDGEQDDPESCDEDAVERLWERLEDGVDD